jgi:hypothetical protein
MVSPSTASAQTIHLRYTQIHIVHPVSLRSGFLTVRVSLRSRQRRERMQEVKQIVGVLPGGVETDDEVNRAIAPDDAFEPLSEEGVAGGRLGKREFGGGGLEVVAEKSGVVAIAGRVDADADASRRLRRGKVVW